MTRHPNKDSTEPFERLCVIGVGLIGGSVARAARATGACREIIGCGRDSAHLEQAQALGVIERYETDPARAVAGADFVVLATPISACATLLHRISPALAEGTIVSDVGSVKGTVVEVARAALGSRFSAFVPGHPIAGAEQSGVEASCADLFRGRCTVLTPCTDTDASAVRRVSTFWETCGARVVKMDVAHHDTVFATTSHLPHLLAYTLVDWMAHRPDAAELFDFTGSGFRDFTRIASSDPVMWRDICIANAEALIPVLDGFRGALDQLRTALHDGDEVALEAIFRNSKRAREAGTD